MNTLQRHAGVAVLANDLAAEGVGAIVAGVGNGGVDKLVAGADFVDQQLQNPVACVARASGPVDQCDLQTSHKGKMSGRGERR